jgi:hypothetical protein
MLCRLQEGFEPLSQWRLVFMPIPQSELIDQHRSQRPALGVGFSLGLHLIVRREDRFELLIEVFNGDRTQFMKEASHFDTRAGMRIGAILGRNQDAIAGLAIWYGGECSRKPLALFEPATSTAWGHEDSNLDPPFKGRFH